MNPVWSREEFRGPLFSAKSAKKSKGLYSSVSEIVLVQGLLGGVLGYLCYVGGINYGIDKQEDTRPNRRNSW
jgi:hypothetical protein